MEPYATFTGILLATCAAYVLGALWYSPLLFMNLWLKGKGVTAESLPKRSRLYMATIMSYAFIAHACIATVLAVVLEVTQPETMKVALSLSVLLAVGFMVSARFIDMVYTVEGKHYDLKNQINFVVTSLYYVAIVLLMAAVLFWVR